MMIVIDTMSLYSLLEALSVLHYVINTDTYVCCLVDNFYNSDLVLFVASLHDIIDFIS